MMNLKYNLTGKRFGSLIVKSFSHKTEKNRSNFWNCICDCGNTRVLSTSTLNRKFKPTQSCGCYRYKMLKEKFDFNRKPVREANLNSLIYTYKKAAKNRNLIYSLSREEFIKLTTDRCFYCELPPSQIHQKPETNGAYIYNGIDRINSNKGYESGNVVTCCKTCNYMKLDMTVQDFLNHIEMIYITDIEHNLQYKLVELFGESVLENGKI